MQSSLVKLLGHHGLFTLNNTDKEKIKIHPQDKMCMLVKAGSITSVKDGTEITDNIINANQSVIIRPEVNLVPSRYHAIIGYNTELVLQGAHVTPLATLVRPKEENKIGLLIRPSKKLDLSDMEYIFELYQID